MKSPSSRRICFCALLLWAPALNLRAIGWDYVLIIAAGGNVTDPGKVSSLGDLYDENWNKLNLIGALNGDARQNLIQWQAVEKHMGNDQGLAGYVPAGKANFSPEMAHAISLYAEQLSQTPQAPLLNAYFKRQTERDVLLAAYDMRLKARAKELNRRGLTLQELSAVQNEIEGMKQDNRLLAITSAAETDSLRAQQYEDKIRLRRYRLLQRQADASRNP